MYGKKILLIGLLILACLINTEVIAAQPGNESSSTETQLKEVYEKALVLEIENTQQEAHEALGGQMTEQKVKVRVLSGPHKGQVLTALNTITEGDLMSLKLRPGEQVVLYVSEDKLPGMKEPIRNIYVSDRVRSPALGWLLIVFIGLLVVIGRWQGIKALFGLGITILGIYKVLLPGLMQGKSPLILTIIVSIGVTLLTMIFVAGFSRKTVAATLGTLGGLLVAGGLAYAFGDLAQLSGLATEEERMLLYVQGLKIDLRGLLFSGILIGALGAIMDVAISIASAVSEIRKANPEMSPVQLVGAGMNVGRDIMGTMANTLILAYTGGALPFMLLVLVYKMEPVRIMNWELIATEIVRALVGSIGLIVSVPITALIAGFLAGKADKER